MLWGTLKIQIGRKINDEKGTKYAVSMKDNANDALRLFASIHTGVASTFEITGDGETTRFPLPSNAIDSGENRVYAVYDTANDQWLTEITFLPGKSLQVGYYIWPQGMLNVNPAVDSGAVYTCYYVAYYNEIIDDNSEFTYLPQWALEAVKLYTAGRTLEDVVSQMTLLGQFRTKVDSGNPEQQPIQRQAEKYIQQFWDLINSHRAPQYDLTT